jgi:aspartate aminotransferase
MTEVASQLNRFLASTKPSATYGVMDRVAARRAQGLTSSL